MNLTTRREFLKNTSRIAAVSALAQSPLGVPAASPLGELAASVKTEVMVNRGATIGSPSTALRVNSAQRPDVVPVGRVFLAPPADQYGLFVEVGPRPHFPPPGALDGWVRRRLGITNDRAVREVAFLIGRKIARVGTPGRLLFERALNDNMSRVVAVMEEELAKALG